MAHFIEQRYCLTFDQPGDHGQVEAFLVGQADVGEEESFADAVAAPLAEVGVVIERDAGQFHHGQIAVDVAPAGAEMLGQPAGVPRRGAAQEGDELQQSLKAPSPHVSLYS